MKNEGTMIVQRAAHAMSREEATSWRVQVSVDGTNTRQVAYLSACTTREVYTYTRRPIEDTNSPHRRR